MKQIVLFLSIIHVPVTAKFNFDDFKASLENTVTQCKIIGDPIYRFKKWKQNYENLFNQLPNSKKQLETLLQNANNQLYNNPMFFFLVQQKYQLLNTTKKSNKNSSIKQLATSKQMATYLSHAAELGLQLPYTTFGQLVWQNEIVTTQDSVFVYHPFYKKTSKYSGKRIKEALVPLDLHYLHFLPGSNDITHFVIEHIPVTSQMLKNISNLKQLTALLLVKNELTELPTELAQLKNLKLLSLSFNTFEKLPEIISELPHLKTFVANNNQLKKDPSAVLAKLSKLKHLNLAHNKISNITIPNTLQSINIEDNTLVNLQGLEKCLNLKYAILKNNPLTINPQALMCLKSIKGFYLS